MSGTLSLSCVSFSFTKIINKSLNLLTSACLIKMVYVHYMGYWLSTRLTSENNQKSLKIKRCTLTYTDDWQQYLFISSLTPDTEVSIWKKKSKIWCISSEHINKNRYCKSGMAYIKTSWKLTLWHADSLWSLENGVQLTFTIDATAHVFHPSGRELWFFNTNIITPKSKCRHQSLSTRGITVPQIKREKR